MIRRSQFSEIHNITNKWNPLYWIPHFKHRSKDKIITQYVPTENQLKKDKEKHFILAWLSLLWFDGEIIGDD